MTKKDNRGLKMSAKIPVGEFNNW